MRLRWTEPAVRDLKDICDYVDERDGPEAARRIALRIYENLNSLLEFPRRGRPGRKPDTRELIISGLPWFAPDRPQSIAFAKTSLRSIASSTAHSDFLSREVDAEITDAERCQCL